MEKVKIELLSNEQVQVPMYETEGASGMDIRVSFANMSEEDMQKRIKGKSVVTTNNGKKAILLRPGDRYLFPTGLYAAVPTGYELQVRPRSGLALKYGVTVLNTPGTIDSDYRGEIGVILVNLSNKGTIIDDGERIAQLVLAKVEKAEWTKVVKLSATKRGEGGFNSTGTK